MDLTPKQRAVLQYLKDYRREHGMPPSYEEIRREFGFASLNSARKHLLQLHRKGFIRSPWKNQKRALEIVDEDEAPRAVRLRVLGSIAAGKPVIAPGEAETVEVPQSLLRKGEHFALRVQGDGMAEDGMVDGDLLVLQRREDHETGRRVISLGDGEAVVVGLVRMFS
jgi:repressor LexA